MRVLEAEEHCKAPKESCDWLNLVIKWLFAELAGFPVNQARFHAFFEDMVLNFRRSRSMGPYVTGTKLVDFDLGQRVPVFKNARVVLEPTEELPLTALVMDMKYEGGLLGIAKLDLIGGWQVYLRGRLCDLSGPLYLMIRGTDFYYAMGRFDELKVRCQIVINGVQFRWLNWLASRLILPEFLRFKLAFPAMKAKYLATPEDLQRILSSASIAPSIDNKVV